MADTLLRVMDAELVLDLAGAESLLMKVFRYADWLEEWGGISFEKPGNRFKAKLPRDIPGIIVNKRFPVGYQEHNFGKPNTRETIGNIILINEKTTEQYISLPVTSTFEDCTRLRVGNVLERDQGEREMVSTNAPLLTNVMLELSKICIDNNVISDDTHEENIGFANRNLVSSSI